MRYFKISEGQLYSMLRDQINMMIWKTPVQIIGLAVNLLGVILLKMNLKI